MPDLPAEYDQYVIPSVRDSQRRYRFPNGYGASVVWHEFAYGGLEMGVLMFEHEGDEKGHLTYDTPVTDDVLGYLNPESLREHLAEVFHLPPWFAPSHLAAP